MKILICVVAFKRMCGLRSIVHLCRKVGGTEEDGWVGDSDDKEEEGAEKQLKQDKGGEGEERELERGGGLALIKVQ